jgi:hypothetical protein
MLYVNLTHKIRILEIFRENSNLNGPIPCGGGSTVPILHDMSESRNEPETGSVGSRDLEDSYEEPPHLLMPIEGPPTYTHARDQLAIMRIEIDGSWSVDDLIHLLTQLEQVYLAAAALESMAEPASIGISVPPAGPHAQTADELLQAVAAFRLGGGLRIRSMHYGSPGYIEVIGALNPLKTVKDGVTENRDINRKREETRLFDERERQRQSMEHEQSMEQERRSTEEMRLAHEREVAKLHLEAETTRAQIFLSVIDRLPPEERTAATATLFQLLVRNSESIANEARVVDIKMLGSSEPTA